MVKGVENSTILTMFAVNAVLARICCCFGEEYDDSVQLSNLEPVILDSSKVGEFVSFILIE